jgi:hypothetical protein
MKSFADGPDEIGKPANKRTGETMIFKIATVASIRVCFGARKAPGGTWQIAQIGDSMPVGVATRTWTTAALGGAAECARRRPWRVSYGALERLGGRASPGHYGRGRCVMSRAERLKSAPTCRPGKLLPPGCRADPGAAVASHQTGPAP